MLSLWYPLHAIRLDRYPVTWLDSRRLAPGDERRGYLQRTQIAAARNLAGHEAVRHLADTHLQRAAELIGG